MATTTAFRDACELFSLLKVRMGREVHDSLCSFVSKYRNQVTTEEDESDVVLHFASVLKQDSYAFDAFSSYIQQHMPRTAWCMHATTCDAPW